MLRVYGVDLLDLWRGTLSPRRVCVLINGLPPGSAYGRARGGAGAWSEETAAALIGSWRVESAEIGRAHV